MTQNILFPLCFHFGSYLSQKLMDFAQIWVILKVESCWACIVSWRFVFAANPSLYRYLIAKPYFLYRS